jgi:hypothetical protein
MRADKTTQKYKFCHEFWVTIFAAFDGWARDADSATMESLSAHGYSKAV